ncbi:MULTISPECIES: response regulator transcription factor [unclassified Frankia]|uniref:helix-turn-helix transcriptional regulator n=1 Tax=unclassified Frankia TaxID=2632575 RepID=UPI002AD3EC9A|nr:MULTISPECIES: response regulator transcription factor [unclassified Frankia]
MSRPIHVLLHASDPITRAGLAAQLAGCPDVDLIDAGPGPGPAAGLPASCGGDTTVDVALVDVALVSVDTVDKRTFDLIRGLYQAGTPVVLIVTDLDFTDVTAVVEAGITALIRRAGATPDQVLAAIRGAASGEGFLPPDLLGGLLSQVRHVQCQVLTPRGLTLSGISERERDVLRLVSEGCDTREIGRQLCYSERTVKNVLQDVTRRYGLRNRSHAVAYALRQGLL